MKYLIGLIMVIVCTMPSFAEPTKVRGSSFEFEGYKFTLTTYENDELDESLWFFTNMEVFKDGVKVDEYKRLPEFTLRERFIINGEPIVYFHKMGGSGGGAGVHRYKLNSKEFDYFEGGYKSEFPSFNEIYKFEDTNEDGNPELFASSRWYFDAGYIYYWTVYEWPLDKRQPIKLREEGKEKAIQAEKALEEFNIPQSRERIALVMLFRKDPTLLNDTIISALKRGDRQAVYNEIKHGLGFPEIAEIFGETD